MEKVFKSVLNNNETTGTKRKISDEYMEVFERYKKRCMEKKADAERE